MNILVWGCGAQSKFLINNNYLDLKKIIGFIDNDKEKKDFYGKKVYLPDEISDLFIDYDYIVVTVKEYSNNILILDQIKKLNLCLENVVFVYNYFRNLKKHRIHEQKNEKLKEISESLFYNVSEINRLEVENAVDIMTCQFDLVDNKKLVGNGFLKDDAEYIKDYTRYRTFELVANEIEKNKLRGAVAEVGVFKGMFAQLLNMKFFDRKLYLFDSFESFKPEEYVKEKIKNNCNEGFMEIFKNTNVDIVLDKMRYPNNCIIRKGFFPQSLQDEEKEESFVFVSIDVDFEDSTYECLNFFFPRLVENGYIFLHDYNNKNLNGVKIAVERFEIENDFKLKKIPISDSGGTLIIIK